MPDETLKGYSILVVDDDTDIRDLYETFFKRSGITTYTAVNGEEGLAAAKKFNPSIILLDLMMPIMDGRAMLKQLKADPELQHIRVIIFSALITELEADEAKEAGADAYVEKSDIEDPEKLLGKVKEVLGL